VKSGRDLTYSRVVSTFRETQVGSMFSSLLPQLSAYCMVSVFTGLSFAYFKHIRSLFARAAAIRDKTIASAMQACVVAVGLGVVMGDYYSLHSVQALVEQLVCTCDVGTENSSAAELHGPSSCKANNSIRTGL
jgi:hypothetical protein